MIRSPRKSCCSLGVLSFLLVTFSCSLLSVTAWSIPKTNHNNGKSTIPTEPRNTRRDFLHYTTAASSSLVSLAFWGTPPVAAVAATTAEQQSQLEKFVDKEHKFSLSVPTNWNKSEQELSDRRKIVIYQDPKDNQSLLFIAYTPVRDDFTSLGSFGSVQDVAQMTILPKGELAGLENESKMLSAESSKQAYFFDYTIRGEGRPNTHFRTIFTLAQGPNGAAGATLVTITVQTPETKYKETYQPVFNEIIGSYDKA